MNNNWCNNALIRKQQIESGLDLTFSNVFVPYFIEAFKHHKPSTALELGCGTGHMALELSGYCKHFNAIEPSAGMHAIAREVLSSCAIMPICSYIEDLPYEFKYDLIYSHMCVQAIEFVKELFENIAERLSSGGVTIFSIPHPCFYNSYKKLIGPSEYSYMKLVRKNISLKISKDQTNLIKDVPYFHRPLSYYFSSITEAGLQTLRFDEIYPSKEVQFLYPKNWDSPRYCVFTLSHI